MRLWLTECPRCRDAVGTSRRLLRDGDPLISGGVSLEEEPGRGAGGGIVVGGGAGGGRVDDALGRPTCERDGVTLGVRLDGVLEAGAAYGWVEGPTGVRGDIEVSRLNMAVPIANIPSDWSAGNLSVSEDARTSLDESRDEVDDVRDRVSFETSDVGEVEDGEDG